MGKIKTRYPVTVGLTFYMYLETEECFTDQMELVIESGNLEYTHIAPKFQDFIDNWDINYETVMFYRQPNDEVELIQAGWSLHINQLEEQGRHLMVMVRSYARYLHSVFESQLALMSNRIQTLQSKVEQLQKKEENQSKLPIPVPLLQQISSLTHQQSMVHQQSLIDKDLDIGVLFSEPMYNAIEKKPAQLPVDFRSEIQRLYSSLTNSYKPEITIQCQIATKQHLRHLISFKKPTILHIICHGSQQGQLQFEEDSKFDIGSLHSISCEKIRKILKEPGLILPQLVFVNSCYSETIGQVFAQCGVRYVIMIDSQDTIDDEAAQMFSQHFYRMIFRGEKVGYAFREARDEVGLKHSNFGCCCRHTSKEKHKEGCLWQQHVKNMGIMEAHRMFHIPNQKCICQMRNFNRHKPNCVWAKNTLFNINRDFRIRDENGVQRPPKTVKQLPVYAKKEFMICCCFNVQGKRPEDIIPHSENNKFKMLPNPEQEQEGKDKPLYYLDKSINFSTNINDFSPSYLIENHGKLQNIALVGRQQEIYAFMKKVLQKNTNLFLIYGPAGIGKTTFAKKSVTYLIQRKAFQMYFFIDLYGFHNKAMFRNKFNQATGLGFPTNKNSMKEVKKKHMLIILDNADQFFMESLQDFQTQIQSLRKEFPNAKILVTCQDTNRSALENSQIIHRFLNVKLNPISQDDAAKVLYSKIKKFLHISVSFMDIRSIVRQTKSLQIPKIIENFTHSFSSQSDVSLAKLKEKVEEIGQGDVAFNKLIEENLMELKSKSQDSYRMLIFISQFSQGIDQSDFNILSMYDSSEQGRKDSSSSIFIDIPVDKNWKKTLAFLFQSNTPVIQTQKNDSSNQSETGPSSTLNNVHLSNIPGSMTNLNLNRYTSFYSSGQQQEQNSLQKQSSLLSDNTFNGDSYFLQRLSDDRLIVKRFIRDFIWNKDKSNQNYYMKHIFVAYMAVLLDIYVKFLVEENYIHEQILQCNDMSQTGVFKYKDNKYSPTGGNELTASIRAFVEYNSRFEKTLKEHPTLKEKIKSSDPSIFIMNHKLDFLHIYSFDWNKAFNYIWQHKRSQSRVLTSYLQRLIILIPTALKIAGAQHSLQKYSIHQSAQLLARIRDRGKPEQNLLLTIKLKLMKAAFEIEYGESDKIIENIDFHHDFHKNDLVEMSKDDLQLLKIQFNYEINFLMLYAHHKRNKQQLKMTDLAAIRDNLATVAQLLQSQLAKEKQLEKEEQKDKEKKRCDALKAKQHLVMSMMYLHLLRMLAKMPTYFSTNPRVSRLKNNFKEVLNLTENAQWWFRNYDMQKLVLKAMLTSISINLEIYKSAKNTQELNQLEKQRQKLTQCEDRYANRKYNLVGFTKLQAQMGEIRSVLKDKLWQMSVNSLVFMSPNPLSNRTKPNIDNLVRRKVDYRQQIAQICDKAKVALSVKFQVLTGHKLRQEVQGGCSILLLRTNTRVAQGKIFLVTQGVQIIDQYLQINKQMLDKFQLSKVKLLVILGNGAAQAIKCIREIMGDKAPSLISVHSTLSSSIQALEQQDFGQNPEMLRELMEICSSVSYSQIQVGKKLIETVLNPLLSSVELVCQRLSDFCDKVHPHMKIGFYDRRNTIIKHQTGALKDLSPGLRKTHNIQMQLRSRSESVYRRWAQTSRVFQQLLSNGQKCLQVSGGAGVGKSTFVRQIGRMCVQRNLFENGVYVLQGRQMEKDSRSDIELYIKKKAERGEMFNLQNFKKGIKANAGKVLLILDDYSSIRPSTSNGKFRGFINWLVQHKVALIFVTTQGFSLRETTHQIVPPIIKLEKLTPKDYSIYAYTLLDIRNAKIMKEFEQKVQQGRMSFHEIKALYKRSKDQAKNQFEPGPEIKKIISMRPNHHP